MNGAFIDHMNIVIMELVDRTDGSLRSGLLSSRHGNMFFDLLLR